MDAEIGPVRAQFLGCNGEIGGLEKASFLFRNLICITAYILTLLSSWDEVQVEVFRSKAASAVR